MIGFIVGMAFVCTVLYFWISFLTRSERMSIEGVPDGWELVRVGEILDAEFFIDSDGVIKQHDESRTVRMNKNYVIIRKIEKPKQYRPFANAAEADCLWNAVLKLANPTNGSEDSRYRINSITQDGATIGLQFFYYKQAFEMFVCTDGTPFGVECEVTE